MTNEEQIARDKRIAMMKVRFAKIEKANKGFGDGFGEIPVAKEEILETAKEDLDAFRESEKDVWSEGEALTSDEKC